MLDFVEEKSEFRCLISSAYQLFFWRNIPPWARASSFTRLIYHTHRRITVDKSPLDEWLARRRDLYLKIQNTHNRRTSMSPVGFEPTISADERPQTYAVDRAATGTGSAYHRKAINQWQCNGLPYLRITLQSLSRSKITWSLHCG